MAGIFLLSVSEHDVKLSGLYPLKSRDDGRITGTMNNLDHSMSNLLHESAVPNPPLIRSAEGYAGDVSPQFAFEWWKAGKAVLVDVRTDAEREWVGFVPGAVSLAWKQWPGMAMNPAFEEGLQAAVPVGQKVLLLCRSGVRSIAAAKRATELGHEAYNILEGFEGDPDGQAQRGHQGGWRYQGLPWRQG